MEESKLYEKWVHGTLTEDELAAFKKTKTYKSVERIINSSASFKAPTYDVEAELQRLSQKKRAAQKSQSTWLTKYAWRAAAVVLVAIGLYFIVPGNDPIEIRTSIGEKTEISLPDGSIVNLNSGSTISYNEGDWNNNRELSLTGEAFFRVKKGSKFSVSTNQGKVTVLGTQFNVFDRSGIYDVTCAEGKVQVEHGNEIYILSQNQGVRDVQGSVENYDDQISEGPSWVNDISTFRGIPLKYVLDELKLQYNIQIDAKGINLEERFTGSFPHSNLELAVKTIVTPLSLEYEINDSVLKISGEK